MHTREQNYVMLGLDRAGGSRQDPGWIAARLAETKSRLIPVWRGRNLIEQCETNPGIPRLVSLPIGQSQALIGEDSPPAFLGLHDETAFFAVDLSRCAKEHALAQVGRGEFVDLRRVGPLMGSSDAGLAAFARGLLHWQHTTQYCGRCGHACENRQGGHMRLCGNADCAREIYPSIHPAVIMLVQRRGTGASSRRCLLGRHRDWPKGVYSTLAGFVEIGESLEQAVAREVLEESGIRVDQIRYQASQPWPFPSSLMLGFRANATSTDIAVDQNELEDARWFSADELRAAGDWQDEAAALRLPRKDSISRFLVECWLRESGAQ